MRTVRVDFAATIVDIASIDADGIGASTVEDIASFACAFDFVRVAIV